MSKSALVEAPMRCTSCGKPTLPPVPVWRCSDRDCGDSLTGSEHDPVMQRGALHEVAIALGLHPPIGHDVSIKDILEHVSWLEQRRESPVLGDKILVDRKEYAAACWNLDGVSGALIDAGDVTVCDDDYSKSIRDLTAQRDALRKVAEAARAVCEAEYRMRREVHPGTCGARRAELQGAVGYRIDELSEALEGSTPCASKTSGSRVMTGAANRDHGSHAPAPSRPADAPQEPDNAAHHQVAGPIPACRPVGGGEGMASAGGVAAPNRNPGDMTEAEIVVACRNLGFDIVKCGACAALFYTGYGGYGHEPGCPHDPGLPEVFAVECNASQEDAARSSSKPTDATTFIRDMETLDVLPGGTYQPVFLAALEVLLDRVRYEALAQVESILLAESDKLTLDGEHALSAGVRLAFGLIPRPTQAVRK